MSDLFTIKFIFGNRHTYGLLIALTPTVSYSPPPLYILPSLRIGHAHGFCYICGQPTEFDGAIFVTMVLSYPIYWILVSSEFVHT